MTGKLFWEAITKFLLGVALTGLLLFLPAGTLLYPGGLLLMVALFLPMLIAGVVMMVKNPKLLASRLDGKEKQKEQGALIKLSGLMFVVGFIVAGLDHRLSLTTIPRWLSYAAVGLLLLSYLMWAEVLRENAYLSRTVKVEAGQRVVDTGLYGVVRHPMYLASLFLFLSMPLVLGSLLSFFVFLLYPVLIVFRIVYEERLLEKELEGYAEYRKKVKYRLIPFVW
ncbi:MAG: isoprenylcysteine carboxylmethyltransferase family protein [Clostridia bacterium]|nr:isoprenylcysteine carboxylmethyltransferase family protein [Clostridia bacterium]